MNVKSTLKIKHILHADDVVFMRITCGICIFMFILVDLMNNDF